MSEQSLQPDLNRINNYSAINDNNAVHRQSNSFGYQGRQEPIHVTSPVSRKALLSSVTDDMDKGEALSPSAGITGEKGQNVRHGTIISTFFNFSKASIGAGSFGLPFALKQSGAILGSIGLVIVSLWCMYTMNLMLECKSLANRYLSRRRDEDLEENGLIQDIQGEVNYQTYADVSDAILPTYGRILSNFSVLLCNIGVGAVYLVLIGDNFKSSFDHLTGRQLTEFECYTFLLPILIILTWLPSYRFLAYAAYIGSIFLASAMIFSYIYAYKETNGLSDNIHTVELFKLSTLPQFFGTAAFLFCVHSMVIPLESSMKRPRDMYTVIKLTCLAVLSLNLPFALYGYLAYGATTLSPIFRNFKPGVGLDFVELSLSLELILTYPLVLMPAIQVIEDMFTYRPTFRNLSPISKIVVTRGIRSAISVVSWALAVAVPFFEDILSLVGGFGAACIGFVLPPLFHVLLAYNLERSQSPGRHDPSFSKQRIGLHVLLLLLGIAAVLLTTILTIQGIVESRKQ